MSADYRVAAKAVKFEKPVSALNKFINQRVSLFALRDVTQKMGPETRATRCFVFSSGTARSGTLPFGV